MEVQRYDKWLNYTKKPTKLSGVFVKVLTKYRKPVKVSVS